MKLTVKDLQELLSRCAPDAVVVLAKDAEGNGFSPFSNLGRAAAVALSTYSYDVVDYDELDYLEPGEPFDVIVLWPLN